MTRFLPRSLIGQLAIVLGLALLIAQIINFALVLNDRQKFSLMQGDTPAITRFATTAADIAGAAPEFREAVASDGSRRGVRISLRPAPTVTETERDSELEARLAAALVEAGIKPAEIRAARGPGVDAIASKDPSEMQFLRLAMRTAEGVWIEGRMNPGRHDPLLTTRLAMATALVYLIVLGAAIWGSNRLAKPLAELKRAAENFAGRIDPVALVPSGPDDIKLAMEAFNSMNGRIVSLLNEKDHLLGAIGHDLRTPLASLRIRVESMEPECERGAAIAKIEEMSTMLEDILVLARSGRARSESRLMDISALAETVSDEFSELGQPVSFTPSPRLVARVDPDLFRRALRNLIDNAVTYGGSANVDVQRHSGHIAIRVLDQGPGIALEDRGTVLAPFQRLEASRNRNTGGSGLGLAIARSIAESHGGALELGQNHPSGLVATLSLPTDNYAS